MPGALRQPEQVLSVIVAIDPGTVEAGSKEPARLGGEAPRIPARHRPAPPVWRAGTIQPPGGSAQEHGEVVGRAASSRPGRQRPQRSASRSIAASPEPGSRPGSTSQIRAKSRIAQILRSRTAGGGIGGKWAGAFQPVRARSQAGDREERRVSKPLSGSTSIRIASARAAVTRS